MNTTTTTITGAPAPQTPQHADLLKRIDALQAALLAQDPQMPIHLREIHKQLITFEELSHLLTEEQIGLIIRAQSQRLGVVLAAETKKSSGKSKRVSADEL